MLTGSERLRLYRSQIRTTKNLIKALKLDCCDERPCGVMVRECDQQTLVMLQDDQERGTYRIAALLTLLDNTQAETFWQDISQAQVK